MNSLFSLERYVFPYQMRGCVIYYKPVNSKMKIRSYINDFVPMDSLTMMKFVDIVLATWY